jgi:lipoprotein-releasing system ATP-binding protein
LLPEFTACENVMLPGLIKGLTKKEAKENAMHLLEKVGLQDRFNHKPSELSGGEQQRTAVCRALMNQPKIIFGDEPSGNLDTKSSQDLHELFFQLRDEFQQTFIIVTHNKELAKMADRSLTMVDGKFV